MLQNAETFKESSHGLVFFTLFLFISIHLLQAIFMSMPHLWLHRLLCVCVCLCCAVVKLQKEQHETCGLSGGMQWGKKKKIGRWGRGTFEDTVSFSSGMFSCVFLFEEATRCFQKLAGNRMLLTAGLIRVGERRRKWEGCFSRKVDYPTKCWQSFSLFVCVCVCVSMRLKKQLLQLTQQSGVSMNQGHTPQRASEQKAGKLRMCSVYRHDPISRFVKSQT